MRPSVLALAFLMTAPAGAALAHARLVRADPAVGATVERAPQRIRLQFNEIIRLSGASGVRLTGPDGRQSLLQPLSRDPKDADAVLAPMPPSAAAGSYKVEWRALSPDGHHTQGAFRFRVKG